jgi:hypothetical protein
LRKRERETEREEKIKKEKERERDLKGERGPGVVQYNLCSFNFQKKTVAIMLFQ